MNKIDYTLKWDQRIHPIHLGPLFSIIPPLQIERRCPSVSNLFAISLLGASRLEKTLLERISELNASNLQLNKHNKKKMIICDCICENSKNINILQAWYYNHSGVVDAN